MVDIIKKLDDIRSSDCEHPPVAHPEFVFDRTQLDDKEPLTKTEIEFINTQLNGAIRKFALDCGCAEHDVLRLKAEYWHSEEGHGFKDNNYVWGLFYDCNQKNYENKRSLSDTPQKMDNFLYLFGKAVGAINFYTENLEHTSEGRHAVGFVQSSDSCCALMRGNSQRIVLPIIKLVELLDPNRTISLHMPERYETPFPHVSDGDLTKIVLEAADPSVFWVAEEDGPWATAELQRRKDGESAAKLAEQIRLERAAQKAADAPTLRQRLGRYLPGR